jgi:hypothetical protein
VTLGEFRRVCCTEEQETVEGEESKRDEDEGYDESEKSLSNELRYSLVFFALGVVSAVVGLLGINFYQSSEGGILNSSNVLVAAVSLVIFGIGLMVICARIALSTLGKIERVKTSKYKHSASPG